MVYVAFRGMVQEGCEAGDKVHEGERAWGGVGVGVVVLGGGGGGGGLYMVCCCGFVYILVQDTFFVPGIHVKKQTNT